MADENNTGDEQFTPDGSMEPLSPQEADNTDYGLMVGERIQKKDLQQEMRDSYLAYAMSVIVDRALPDVRDGMKPVHRRVIYAMYDGGYRPDRGYSKCARVVGEVMGKYHPHGDSAIYDTLVRMAQSWSMRYTLVDGQGNFGSPGDDPAAAMRYTECRMAPLAMEMVRDIDKDTVDFLPNYDGKTQEPTVLPARFPNLLCNGSSGIAVGMATNIPPHNMREVAEGVHWALDHPDASREELLDNLIRIIKGPDFPTGATILGHKGIEQAYRTGRGLITMRAVVNTEEINGRMCLVVTELPYQVNPDRLVVSIREAVRDGKIQGIADMRDETSGRTGQRLVLVLKRDAVPKVVLNNLYKHSQLQQTFGANMLALVDGVPRTLSLDAFIRHWVNHQLDVIARRTAYLKREAEERDHILQGYLKALDMLDEVIALIRASEDTDTARTGLMGLLDIDQVQADAILAMQLRTLTRMNRDKIVAEHEELQRKIADYIDILAKPERQRKIIGDELDDGLLLGEHPQQLRVLTTRRGQLGQALGVFVAGAHMLVADQTGGAGLVLVQHGGEIAHGLGGVGRLPELIREDLRDRANPVPVLVEGGAGVGNFDLGGSAVGTAGSHGCILRSHHRNRHVDGDGLTSGRHVYPVNRGLCGTLKPQGRFVRTILSEGGTLAPSTGTMQHNSAARTNSPKHRGELNIERYHSINSASFEPFVCPAGPAPGWDLHQGRFLQILHVSSVEGRSLRNISRGW